MSQSKTGKGLIHQDPKKQAKPKTNRNPKKTGGKTDVNTLANKLIALKAKQDKIKEEIDELKTTLIDHVRNNDIETDKGTVSLKASNSWSLEPINAGKAQELLKESFTFYFKEKLSYGVEQLAKNLINSLKNGDLLSDEQRTLAEELTKLVEIKQTESWTIKART